MCIINLLFKFIANELLQTGCFSYYSFKVNNFCKFVQHINS